MLRKVAVGAAGSAAAASPSTSHCYQRPAARAPHNAGQTIDHKGAQSGPAEHWEWVFPEDEVAETTKMVLGFDPRTKPATVIEEVTDRERDSTDSDSDLASSSLMQEADKRIISQARLQENFGSSLMTLLNDQAVQRACMDALHKDPAFSEMLMDLDQQAPLRGAQSLPNLLPAAAQSAEAATPQPAWQEGTIEDNLKVFLDTLALRVTGLGETIRGAWDKAGAAVGGTVLRMGYAIHTLLGRRFQTGSSPEYSWDSAPPADTSEKVGKVMLKVAVVVVALLVFRRVVR